MCERERECVCVWLIASLFAHTDEPTLHIVLSPWVILTLIKVQFQHTPNIFSPKHYWHAIQPSTQALNLPTLPRDSLRFQLLIFQPIYYHRICSSVSKNDNCSKIYDSLKFGLSVDLDLPQNSPCY